MKNLLLTTLLLATTLFLTSCGGDDDSNGYNPAILGTWKLTAINFANGSTTDVTSCDQIEDWKFNQDGTVNVTDYQNATSGGGCQEFTTETLEYGMDVPNVFTLQDGNDLTTWSYSLNETTMHVSGGYLDVDQTYVFTKQ